jgi:hypothetical protein
MISPVKVLCSQQWMMMAPEEVLLSVQRCPLQATWLAYVVSCSVMFGLLCLCLCLCNASAQRQNGWRLMLVLVSSYDLSVCCDVALTGSVDVRVDWHCLLGFSDWVQLLCSVSCYGLSDCHLVSLQNWLL